MKALPDYDSIDVGYELPTLRLPPITRQMLAIYCGASGDHNPIHVDIDFAQEAGLDDVIAHGMLIMAYAGRVLTNWVPQTAILAFNTRFLAMTDVGDQITANGRVVEKILQGPEYCLRPLRSVRVEIEAIDQDGIVKASGTAFVELG